MLLNRYKVFMTRMVRSQLEPPELHYTIEMVLKKAYWSTPQAGCFTGKEKYFSKNNNVEHLNCFKAKLLEKKTHQGPGHSNC